MLNLDNYINNTLEVTLFGKAIKVKEPSMRMFNDIDKIEKDLTVENLREKRLEIAMILINHNTDNERFSKEQLLALPFEAINIFVDTIAQMRYKADHDPNS